MRITYLLTFINLYQHCRAEIVRWVAESKRPFAIVKDRGYQKLMKTGRPDYKIPSPDTVSRDVKKVFVRVRKRVAKMLQVMSLLWSKIDQLTYLQWVPGARRGTELCYRCLDLSKQQGVCGRLCPFRRRRHSDLYASRHC